MALANLPQGTSMQITIKTNSWHSPICTMQLIAPLVFSLFNMQGSSLTWTFGNRALCFMAPCVLASLQQDDKVFGRSPFVRVGSLLVL